MSNRFWVGGTGTWDASDTTHWAAVSGGAGGQSVPGASDAVYFDANSGGGKITLNYSPSVLLITGGDHTGEFDTAGYDMTVVGFTYSGSGIRTLTLNDSVITITGSGTVILNLPTITNLTVTPNTATFNCTYSGSTGTRQISIGAIPEASSFNVKVSAGTDGLNIVADSVFKDFDITGYTGTKTNTRMTVYGNLTFEGSATYTGGTNAITLAATSGTQVVKSDSAVLDCPMTFDGAGGTFQLFDNLNLGATRNLTLNKGSLLLNGKQVTCAAFNSTGTDTRSILFGTNGVLNCTSVGFQITTGLNFDKGTGSTINCSGTISSGSTSGNGLSFPSVTLTGNTSTITGRTGITNTFEALTRTGTAAKTDTMNIAGDVTVTGTLTINGNSAINRIYVKSSINGTQRTITAGTIVTQYCDWQDIIGAGTANWDLTAQATNLHGNCGNNSANMIFTTPETQTATGTDSFTWSTHGWTTRVPLTQDDVIVNNSFGASKTVTIDMPRFGKNVDFSGCTGTPTVNFSTGLSSYGDLNLTGTTVSGTNTYNFQGSNLGTRTFTTGGATLTFPLAMACPGCTVIWGDNITTSATSAVWTGSTVALAGTLNTNGKTLTINGSNTTARTFSGGGRYYDGLTITGSGIFTTTITGANTFTTITIDRSAASKTLALSASASGRTIVQNLVCATSGTTVATISSTASKGQLVKSGGGVISLDYMTVTNITASPSTTWYMGTHSTDGGGNTYVYFTAPAVVNSTYTLKKYEQNPLHMAISYSTTDISAGLIGNKRYSRNTWEM